MKQHQKALVHLIRKVREMNCYICEKSPGPSGTQYHVKTAVGVCQHCGIGICMEHSHKDAEPGSLLLCPSCAHLFNIKSHRQLANVTLFKESQG